MEFARMVGRQHHMMPREAAADIAKQFELSSKNLQARYSLLCT